MIGRDANEILDRVDELPPLPAVAARIMSMADEERTSALDLAQVISTDQALTAKLIRVSNSAYYGFARRVSTVREAVLVLGFKQVRQLVVGASVMNGFKRNWALDDGAFDLDLFWGHSVATAVGAEAIAKATHTARPEDAFTAGILHDIGRLVICQVMPTEFASAVSRAKQSHTSLHETERELTGYDHAEVGRALGERWRFPWHLAEAIATHHDESLQPADGLGGVIAQANRLALHYGLYCGYDDEHGSVGPMPADLAAIEQKAGSIDRVLERALAFIESASGSPDRWHAAAGQGR